MKISNTTRIARENLTDAPDDEWIDLLLNGFNQASEQLTQALQQNLTIADNMNAAIVTHRFTHGQEISIPNPLKTRPVGIKAIRSAAINGGVRYRLAGDPDWRFIDGTDPRVPQQLGVMVAYAPPVGSVSIRRDAAQSMADDTVVPLQFDTVDVAAIGALSIDTTTTSGTPPVNSRIVCSAAGTVAIHGNGCFEPGGTNTLRAFWFQKNNSTASRWGIAFSDDTFVGANECISARIPVNAGDYIQFAFQQISGGALDTRTGAEVGPRIQARYDDVPIGSKNDVTLLIYGG